MSGAGTLRVIGGELRGRRLRTAGSPETRPMTDRVRESLFAILDPEIPESSFLDLFAGSGAVGIEALSRGASSAVFVERGSLCADTIAQNLRSLGLQERALVMRSDSYAAVSGLGAGCRHFNIVFAGPPYDAGHHNRILAAVIEHSICADGGTIVLQYRAGDPLNEPDGYSVDTRTYGITCLSFLQRADA